MHLLTIAGWNIAQILCLFVTTVIHLHTYTIIAYTLHHNTAVAVNYTPLFNMRVSFLSLIASSTWTKKKRNYSRRKSTNETVGRKRNSKVQTMLYVTVCFCFRTETPNSVTNTNTNTTTGPASAELELSWWSFFSATLLPLPLALYGSWLHFCFRDDFSVVTLGGGSGGHFLKNAFPFYWNCLKVFFFFACLVKLFFLISHIFWYW